MGRAPCCDKVGLKRGPWTPEEDHVLVSFIMQHGHSNWRALPKQAGLLRCGKSCRLRWMNYLKPDVKRGNFTKEEEDTIIQLHEMMGNRWSAIAAKLPGRTDNEIKNVWHTHLKKRLNNQNQVTNKKNCKNNNKKQNNKNNTNSINITTTTTTTSSETPNYSSQQSYSSDQEFSSTTEVSSLGDDHQLPIIDDSFWSSPELLSYDDIISMDFVFPQVIENDNSNNNFSTIYVENNNYNNNGHVNNEGESMDFWLDVFVNAGGPLELPQF